MDTPKGLLILLHNGFATVGRDEALEAVPEAWRHLDRPVVEVQYSQLIDLAKVYETGYEQYALEHRRIFANRVLPILTAHPDYKIIYFGLAPITLCVDFGHLLHNYRDVLAFQKHHTTKQWYADLQENPMNELRTSGVPDRNQKGISDALIRLSISHPINPDDTFEILPNAAEVDIALEHPDEDALATTAQIAEVAEAVKQTLDELSNNRSGLDRVHLFAAMGCGLAFLVGTKISPNIHAYIQTYHFSRTKTPRYRKALLIKAQLRPEQKIGEEERRLIDPLREASNVELVTNIRSYLDRNEEMSRSRIWFQGIAPKHTDNVMLEDFWRDLPALYETSLKKDSFDMNIKTVNGFKWERNKWVVDDSFFLALRRRLKDLPAILQAVRLFLFHEALHYKKHRLNSHTVVEIGSFPKVLETADYQSDVYAIINEYGYSLAQNSVGASVQAFFLKAIGVATETMWSFDDNGQPLEEIQIRRLNRYMIWYWQCARIEQEGKDLATILKILSDKPVIELNGLVTREDDNRFYFVLEKRKDTPLELAIFYKNELVRSGSATNLPIENLVEGVRQMNGRMILDVMRSFVSQ